MTTERLVNFPAKTNPAGTDIVYVGDQSSSGNEVKSTIAQLGAGMGGVVLLVANNLSDVASASASRTNLGLGTAATFAATAFLQVANNLSDLASVTTARSNLGLGTAATHAATDFLQAANNLSDLASAATARTNLGLGTAAVKTASGSSSTVASVFGGTTVGHLATFADAFGTIQDGGSMSGFLLVANNLSDVASAATSRTNLGLGTVATKAASDNTKSTVAMISGAITIGHYAQFVDTAGTLQDGGSTPAGVLLSANNLSDVASASTSRTNLGLGNAAVKTVTDNVQTSVASVTGAFTVGHLIVAADTAGTIQDGGTAPGGILLASNNLSDVASASTSRTNLGLGTAATQNSTFFLQAANNLSDLTSASTARTNLGLGTAAVKAASDNTKATLASVTGSFTIGHLATFADVSGTIQDGGAIPSFTPTAPNIQRFTSGTGATYTVPANALYLRILMKGGGAGGQGAGSAGGGGGGEGAFIEHLLTGTLAATYIYTVAASVAAGTNGNASTFSGGSLSAGGGLAGIPNCGGAGGTPSGGNVQNVYGCYGGVPHYVGSVYYGGVGGGSGGGTPANGSNATAGATNSGGGGGGADSNQGAAGGGAAGWITVIAYFQ